MRFRVRSRLRFNSGQVLDAVVVDEATSSMLPPAGQRRDGLFIT